MKYLTITVLILLSFFFIGCNPGYIPSNRDNFYRYSDSFNTNLGKGYIQLAKMNTDSAFYYAGKQDAYREMEHFELNKK